MRALRQPRLLAVSVPVGVGMALLCVPLVLAERAPSALRLAQLLALPLLCVLLVQVALAWTPDCIGHGAAHGRTRRGRQWYEMAVLGLLLAGLRLLTDLWLRRILSLPEISDWATFFRKLPFSSLVQPLFLVVAVYAFALRLSGRPQRALVAVPLAHQLIVLLQFGSAVDGLTLAAMLVAAGVQGLVMGASYWRYGVAGPVVLAVVTYARHIVYVLQPALTGLAPS